MLEIDIDEEITLICRLRYADAEPLSMETSILVSKYVPGILKNDFSKRSLRETLLTDYGIELVYAQQTIRAQQVPGDVAKHLGIEADDPVLTIERLSYSQNNTPIEFLRIFYRADRYAFHSELRGGAGFPTIPRSGWAIQPEA